MRELLVANVRTLLRFYARSRLLLAVALLMLVMLALSLVPMLLFETATSRFETLRRLYAATSMFAFFFTPILGLLAIATHLRQRNVKMVVTKPCPPEVWLAAVFVSGSLVALVLHALVAATSAALSLAWGVPYQWGFLLLAIEGFLESLVALSFVVALTLLVHPVLAAIVALFFNESLFYELKVLLAGAQAGAWRTAVLPGQVLVDVLYTILPIYDPMGDKGATLRQSMRAETGDWLLLGVSAAYAIVAAAFSFALSSLALRRRTLS